MARRMECEALAGQSGSREGRFEAILVPARGVFRQVWLGGMGKDPALRRLPGAAPLSPKEDEGFRRQGEESRPLVFDGGEGDGGLLPKQVLPPEAEELGAAQAGEEGEPHLRGIGRRKVGEESPFIARHHRRGWGAGGTIEPDLTPEIHDPRSRLDDGAHGVPQALEIVVDGAFASLRQTSRRPEGDAGLFEILRGEVEHAPRRPVGGPPVGKPLLLTRRQAMGGLREIECEQLGDGVVDRHGLPRGETLFPAKRLGAGVKFTGFRLTIEAPEVLHAAVHRGADVPAALPVLVGSAVETAFVLCGAGHQSRWSAQCSSEINAIG